MSYGGAFKIGGMVGVGAVVVMSILGLIGTVCCLGGLVNMVMPAGPGSWPGRWRRRGRIGPR